MPADIRSPAVGCSTALPDAPASAASLFAIRDLSFAYLRRPVLSCTALDLAPGRASAFVGTNGSGKTTLLKLLNALLGPYQGTIRFDGQPLRQSPELRRRTVYLHQHPVLFAGSVWSNLAFALKLKKIRGAELSLRIEENARRFGLVHLLQREASRLSGGETQRVAVARAVAAGADVLLLDEPTSALDQASESALRTLLGELRQSGITLIFSAHDRSLVDELADDVYLFEDGSVQAADMGGL